MVIHRASSDPRTRALHQALIDYRPGHGTCPWPLCPRSPPQPPYFVDWLDHPSYDAYWRRWSVDEQYARIGVPALHIGRWYDTFAEGTDQNFEGIRTQGTRPAAGQQKLLMGPWHHAVEVSGSAAGHPASTDGQLDAWQVRWFNQFLRDEDTGVLDSEATIDFLGASRWEDLSWPVQTTPGRLHLRSRGRANSKLGDATLSLEPAGAEPPGVYAYDPAFPTPSAGGTSCCSPDLAPVGAVCQHDVESSNDVLVYTSCTRCEELT